MNKLGIGCLAAAFGLGFAAYVQSQPGNDDCLNALPLAVPSSTMGTTIGSTVSPEASFCGTSVGTGGGVWYTVTGTGNTMTASTCNAADYDTKISIFCGDCASLTCVDGLDDTAGCAGFTTELDWASEAGAEYDIYVHGFSAATGNFTLSISDDGTPSGATPLCPVSVPLFPTSFLVIAALLLAAIGIWRLTAGRLTGATPAALLVALLVLPVAVGAQSEANMTAESGQSYTVIKNEPQDRYDVEDSRGDRVGAIEPMSAAQHEAFDAEGNSLGVADSLQAALDLIDESLSVE